MANCRYVAEGFLDDFPVCPLHDVPHVRAILEAGRLPGAFVWPDGRPIVLPCGELEERHFEPGEATMRASEDPRLLEAPEAPTAMVRREFDLTQEWLP